MLDGTYSNSKKRIATMRREIAAAYPGRNWQVKCMYIFSPSQVAAIHKSLTNRDELNKKKPKKDGVQISMWDLGVFDISKERKDDEY